MPATRAWSSALARWTRTWVRVPRTSTADARPIDMIRKGVPKPVACATRASTTSAADDTARWMLIRDITSDHVIPLVARRLQCSVARIWATADDGATAAGATCASPGAARRPSWNMPPSSTCLAPRILAPHSRSADWFPHGSAAPRRDQGSACLGSTRLGKMGV